MNKNNKVLKKENGKAKSKMGITIIVGLAVLFIAAILIAKGISGDENKTALGVDVGTASESASGTANSGSDLVIPKGEITETAKFYPTKVGGTNMEVLAVKADDGSIRTAFNTCQVCNGSPKAYYKQQGDVLVCQNCGNRFSMDMVEKQRGGCNPVPIMQDEKTDDGSNIIISKDILAKNKDIFTANWKTQ